MDFHGETQKTALLRRDPGRRTRRGGNGRNRGVIEGIGVAEDAEDSWAADSNGKQWQSAEGSEAVQGSEGVERLKWAGCEERRGWQRAAIEARRSLQNTVSNAEHAEYEEYMEDRTGLRRAAEDRGGPRRTAEDRGGKFLPFF